MIILAFFPSKRNPKPKKHIYVQRGRERYIPGAVTVAFEAKPLVLRK